MPGIGSGGAARLFEHQHLSPWRSILAQSISGARATGNQTQENGWSTSWNLDGPRDRG